jgi:hypothetical protein
VATGWGDGLANKELFLQRDGFGKRAWRVETPDKEVLGRLRWARFPYSMPAVAEAGGRRWRFERVRENHAVNARDVSTGTVVAEFGWERKHTGRLQRPGCVPLNLAMKHESGITHWILRTDDGDALLGFGYRNSAGTLERIGISIGPLGASQPDLPLLILLAGHALQRENLWSTFPLIG